MKESIRKLNKALLLELAKEFDADVTERNTVKEIRSAKMKASAYSVELPKISFWPKQRNKI